jgi:peptide/nickel transport system substrate-binding protein
MRKLVMMAAVLAIWFGQARAETADTPQYGGTLNVGPVYITLSALSWDPADFNWMVNEDTGAVYEQLFAADLSKAESRDGKYPFVNEAYLPPGSLRGELAESWEWQQNPLRLSVKLRNGVMFPEKPGVMDSRELVAADVVNAFNRLDASPRKPPAYLSHIAKVEAIGRYEILFTFKTVAADWDARFGWGFYSAIYPHEVAESGMADWRHANGSGPFALSDFVAGNSRTYTKNPIYWDSETIAGRDYKLPFLDKVVIHTIKDQASWIAALRTGKLDILESFGWQDVDSLKKSAPQLQWHRWLSQYGQFIALRVDQGGPLKDIRVRRALNMAVNKQEIVSDYYNGNAELFAYPEPPSFAGYFEPLEKMPPSVQSLFAYHPEAAKKLLAEAGYPNGFG